MAGLSPVGEVTVLGSILGTVFIAMHTTDPGASGAGEVSGDPAYTRQPGTFSTSGSNPTIAANSAIISFPIATANWGTVGFFGLWSQIVGGGSNAFVGSGAVAVPQMVNTGDQVRFLTGALTVSAIGVSGAMTVTAKGVLSKKAS